MDQQIIDRGYGFATYPSVYIKEISKEKDRNGNDKLEWVKHLLFGDWIGLSLDTAGALQYRLIEGKQYVRVRGRNKDGYILPAEIQFERILEVNFIDVGQGDGCHLVTPDDKHFLIDAGDSDNMYRFLKWRFNLKPNSQARTFTTVISHSDKDHYNGFNKIFANKEGWFNIDKVYHNTLIETSGKKTDDLGTPTNHNNEPYLTDICSTHAQSKTRLAACSGMYATLLKKTSAQLLGLLKGSAPIYNNGNMIIEVLGPVAVSVNGKNALPVFDDKGKTKNGHSVILRLTIGKLKLLLGGDLNELSEDWIMQQYSGIDIAAERAIVESNRSTPLEVQTSKNQIAAAINSLRQDFQVDIAKSCHHGSNDFTVEFMQCLNPIATVISSGDEEPHVHPRPDTLGTIGKHSRGERSLIFSTELARSTVEFFDRVAIPVVNTAGSNERKMTRERVVTTYGMINIRTDGEKVIVAQKLEAKASRGSWDIHKLIWDAVENEFKYIH